MPNKYKGTIIEESLIDNRIINDLQIIGFRISEDENPIDRWHLYTIMVDDDDIDRLSRNIKAGWYMHFWQDKDIIAIFKDRIFKFNYDDKASWESATNFGLSMGIPREQLDFIVE